MENLESPEIKRRSRGRPSPEQAIALRESFLAAALESFLDKGYAATSIEAIAREAGVAKITIYRQFDNKEALFREVVHRAVSNARETMQATLVQPCSDERQVLLDLIERMYLGATEPKTLALLRLVIAEAVRFPELAKSLYAENSYVLAPVVEYLAEAHKAGTLYVPSPSMVRRPRICVSVVRRSNCAARAFTRAARAFTARDFSRFMTVAPPPPRERPPPPGCARSFPS